MFVSGNVESGPKDGRPGRRMRRMWNGMRPTQAASSNVSTRKPAGSNDCTTVGSYRQCTDARSCQPCNMTGHRTAFGGEAEIVSMPLGQ